MSRSSKLALCFYRWCQNVFDVTLSHWPIIFNIRVSSCACELWTDVKFFFIKVSSVIQTISAALMIIKGKMSNLSINRILILIQIYICKYRFIIITPKSTSLICSSWFAFTNIGQEIFLIKINFPESHSFWNGFQNTYF